MNLKELLLKIIKDCPYKPVGYVGQEKVIQITDHAIKSTISEVLALAPPIIEEIINELKDRRGLSQEWDRIDRDLQDEIRAEWTTIIQEKVTELKTK